jgi:hypothetical protein
MHDVSRGGVKACMILAGATHFFASGDFRSLVVRLKVMQQWLEEWWYGTSSTGRSRTSRLYTLVEALD